MSSSLMSSRWSGPMSRLIRSGILALALSAGLVHAPQALSAPAPNELGASPPASVVPHLEFAFEFHVTLAPAVVVGETLFGRRQYIPITGGAIAGPKFSGEVVSGGWYYQLGLSDGCSALSADYFIRAKDGTLIHVLNEGLACNGKGAERSFFRPRFEAPKGPHEWLTRSTFVATLELEGAGSPAAGGAPQPLRAIRLKFYQVK
jgi:hypothetical protein